VTNISATDAARGFSAMLDAVEAGERFTVLRGGRPVAEVGSPRVHTLGALRQALAPFSADPDWAATTESVLAAANTPLQDPWATD
jgi:antitoxin (DNA-binding transcriptional repressor) of toxin-antitoxin stability system